jgi:hypothetical protein
MASMDQVRRAMHRQPFLPFLIKLVNGTTYQVKHPDFVALTHRRELVFVSDDDGLHEIDLALVAEIETPGAAAQPAPPGSAAANGP